MSDEIDVIVAVVFVVVVLGPIGWAFFHETVGKFDGKDRK